jgi:hypothetical protein
VAPSKITPVAIFVYKRPEKTLRLLEQLSRDEIARQLPILAFSDAARNVSDYSAVQEVRQILKKKTWFKNYEVIERPENWGLYRSLTSGITQTCNEFGEVITLEDDLEFSPSFFPFMIKAMELYRDAPKVFSVTGYSYPTHLSGLNDAFFICHSSCWGWGTWKRSWDLLITNGTSAYNEITNSKTLRKQFNMNGGYDYVSLLEKQIRGEISSWGVLWYTTMFLNGGLLLMPRKSMVANCGADAESTHYGAEGYPDRLHDISDPQFPTDVIQDKQSYDRISRYLALNSASGRFNVINKIKRATHLLCGR